MPGLEHTQVLLHSRNECIHDAINLRMVHKLFVEDKDEEDRSDRTGAYCGMIAAR